MAAFAALMLGFLLILPSGAFAERWYGIIPGATTRDEVQRILGEPSRTLKEPAGHESWVYEGEQAPFGTSGVGIVLRLDSGLVDYIEVDPLQHMAWPLLKERYGEPDEKTAPKEGLSIYRYPRRGLLIIMDTGKEVAVKFGFYRGTTPAGPPAPSAGSPPPPPPSPR